MARRCSILVTWCASRWGLTARTGFGMTPTHACKLLMISTLAPGNVVVYPDAGKVLARSRWFEGVFKAADKVPYWGE